MKYQITVDEKHFRALDRAVESYMRLQIGQGEMLADDLCGPLETGEYFNTQIQQQSDVKKIIETAYEIACPYYYEHRNSNLCLLLEDFYEVIKHELWLENPNRSEIDVHAGPIMKWGDGEMPEVRRIDDQTDR